MCPSLFPGDYMFVTPSPDALPPEARDLSLNELRIVDAAPPEAFDNLTKLATKVFDVPVALVSIVQENRDRQYFSSQQGLPEPWACEGQTPLTHSFCQYVKKLESPLVVRDARCHDVVHDNLAIRDLNVIAYLGVPVTDQIGNCIGALCVIDGKPRDWSTEDVEILKGLANCVNNEVVLRAALVANIETQHRTRRCDSLIQAVGAAFSNPDLSANDQFRDFLGASVAALDLTTGVIASVKDGHAEVAFSHRAETDPNSQARVGLAGALAELALDRQEAVCFSDMAQQSRVGERAALDGRFPGCYMSAPLSYGGQHYGLIELFGPAPRLHPWYEEDLALFNVICALAGANLAANAMRLAKA